MKAFIAFFLLVAAGFGCSLAADRPTSADVNRAVGISRLAELRGFTVDRVEYSARDRLDRYAVGVWGHGLDRDRDVNTFVVFIFNKEGQPPAWDGVLTHIGQVTELARGADRKAFYNSTLKNWEKARQEMKK